MLPYQDLTTKMLSLNNTFFLNNSKISTVFGYTENLRNEFEEHHHEEHRRRGRRTSRRRRSR